MHPSPAVGLLAVTTGSGPQVTDVVRVRSDAPDASWPPVLIVCAAVVVLGGLLAAVVFLRRAREAGRASGGPLDG